MGHRHFPSHSFMIEAENDQSWNMTEHPYTDIASSAAESSSLVYPVDNISIDGVQHVSHCNPAPVSSGYSSMAHNIQIPHYQQDAAGPADLRTHSSSARAHYTVSESHRNLASSSNYNEHPFHEDDFFDIMVDNGRGQYKRKSPDIPAVCERDGRNRYNNDAGNSSEVSMLTDPSQETHGMDFLHTPWDSPAMNPSYSGSHFSFGGENSLRNVRSRAALDLETNLARTFLSPGYCTTNRQMDVSPSVDVPGQSSHGPMGEWHPTHISSSADDSSSLNHESNPFLIGSNNRTASVETRGQNSDLITSNHVPQSFRGTSVQSVRGVRSSYSQRSVPTFRASSSSMQMGHAVASDDRMQLAPDSYSFQHPRPSSIRWRTSDQNGRARMSSERYRTFSDDTTFRDQPAPEGLTIVDLSAFNGSRNPFDQHRHLRLDIDDMSYEELLALGERIGSVNTGLSEDLISKSLRESIYCSSDQMQDEGNCVICLEGYANMDGIGTLEACGHDFHVGCIRKWLSMKNLCPICKTEPSKQK